MEFILIFKEGFCTEILRPEMGEKAPEGAEFEKIIFPKIEGAFMYQRIMNCGIYGMRGKNRGCYCGWHSSKRKFINDFFERMNIENMVNDFVRTL